jgi:hypothetical protein
MAEPAVRGSSIMERVKPAESPDAYVEGLDGWRRETVEILRSAALSAPALDENIKWGD